MFSSVGLPETSQAMPAETEEILKGIRCLGLKISEHEIEILLCGEIISLEDRSLSEIGSVFILAQALLKLNSLNCTTFKDLLKVVTNFSNHPGLPIYRWNSERYEKCYLLLSFVDSKPLLRVSLNAATCLENAAHYSSDPQQTIASKTQHENSLNR